MYTVLISLAQPSDSVIHTYTFFFIVFMLGGIEWVNRLISKVISKHTGSGGRKRYMGVGTSTDACHPS